MHSAKAVKSDQLIQTIGNAMTSTTTAPVETSPGELSWKLVHTEPGALVYSVPGVNPPAQSLVRRVTGRTGSEWVPSGTPATHAEPSEHPVLQYAEYIGRVGLLAAALGVGAAVANVPGIAWAEPTDSGSTTSSTSTAATSESTTTESDTSSTKGGESPTSPSSPTTTVSSSGGAQTSSTLSSPQTSTPSGTSTASPETSTAVSAPGDASPPAVVRSSGGALTSTTRRGPKPVREAPAQQPAAPADEEPAATSQTAGHEPTAPAAPNTEAQQRDQQPEHSAVPAIPTPKTWEHHGSETTAGPVQLPSRGAPPAAHTGTSAGTTGSADHERAEANQAGLPVRPATTASASTPASTVTLAHSPQPVSTQPGPTASTMPSAAPINVVTDLLGTLGLAPLGNTTNAPAPVGPPTTWAVLDVARRQKTRADDHGTTGAAGPAPTSLVEGAAGPDGAISGALPLANPAEALTYHVAGGPAHGTVAIHPDGTFTYTPSTPGDDDEFGLQDSFTVTVSDADGNSSTVPVTLATEPATTAPTMSLRVSDPGGNDAVHISVAPTDPGTDQLGHLVVHNPSYATTPLTYDASTTIAGTAAIAQADEAVVDTIGVGGTPTHIAVSPDGGRAYIINTTGKSVSVIDTATNEVITTIPVGRTPTQVAVSPNGTRAYVTNTTSNTVSVIDTDPVSATYNTVIATIRVGRTPTQVAVSPNSSRAYVTNTTSNTVSVIDTDPVSATYNTVVATIRVGWTPTQIAVTPDGTAYVTNATSKSVSVINTSTNTVIRTIRVGWTPTQIVVSPDGTSAYVTNTASNTVSVINTNPVSNTYNTVVATIRVGRAPTQIAVSRDGTLAYVTNTGSKSVSVIDTANKTVIDTIGVGRAPTQVALSPDGALVYVTNTGSKSVSVIDTATNTVVNTVNVGNGPIALAIVPGGTGPVVTQPTTPSTTDPTTGAGTGYLGVVDPDGDPLTITVTSPPAYGTVTFDETTGAYTYVPNQAGRIRAGLGLGNEDGFTVNITQPGSTTQGAQIYVVNTNSNTVSVIGAQPVPAARAMTAAAAPAALAQDGFSTEVIVTEIPIAPAHFEAGAPIPVINPYGLAVSPDGTRAYVVGANVVSVIYTDNNNVIGDPIPVGAQPTRVAFSPDGTRAYVTNEGSDTVSVINTDTTPDNPDYNKVIATIPINATIPGNSTGPIALAVIPNGPAAGTIYVANLNDGSVSVIHADTYAVDPVPIPVDSGPQGIAASPDGTHVYVTSATPGGRVSVIDTTTDTVIKTIKVGDGSFAVAVSPNSDRVYVTGGFLDADGIGHWTMSVIDTADPNPDIYDTVTSATEVNEFAVGLALNPEGTLAYITHYNDSSMSVMDIAAPTPEFLTTLKVGDSPLVVAVTPVNDGNLIYVANDNPYDSDNTVTVISIVPDGATP